MVVEKRVEELVVFPREGTGRKKMGFNMFCLSLFVLSFSFSASCFSFDSSYLHLIWQEGGRRTRVVDERKGGGIQDGERIPIFSFICAMDLTPLVIILTDQ